MASPLPKTKAPASANVRPTFSMSGHATVTPIGTAPASATSSPGGTRDESATADRRERTISATTPEPRNNQTTSDSVHAVVTALTPNNVQSNQSLANVSF